MLVIIMEPLSKTISTYLKLYFYYLIPKTTDTYLLPLAKTQTPRLFIPHTSYAIKPSSIQDPTSFLLPKR